jgi:hypothetical protein
VRLIPWDGSSTTYPDMIDTDSLCFETIYPHMEEVFCCCRQQF